MDMREYFAQGYRVVVGSMWGDEVVEDVEVLDDYADDEDLVLSEVDDEARMVYYYADVDPEEEEMACWEESCGDYDEVGYDPYMGCYDFDC